MMFSDENDYHQSPEANMLRRQAAEEAKAEKERQGAIESLLLSLEPADNAPLFSFAERTLWGLKRYRHWPK